MAGGFFTTKYNRKTEGVEDGSRFDPNKTQGKVRILRARRMFHPYWNAFRATDGGKKALTGHRPENSPAH